MNVHISGNLSKPTVIFIAGWPDTCDVFRDNVMATLAADHRIVGITISGFDDEHPFLQDLREREQAVQLARQEDQRRRHGTTSWWTALSPFGLFPSSKAAPAASLADHAAGRYDRAPLQAFGLPDRSDCLEPFTTPLRGHSFEDLVTLLEIAVDTAMETCNYCPAAMPPASSGAAAEPDASQGSADGVAAHQLPPTYTRPVLIAHDWGCVLAYELLLARPGLFSRIVAMDVGASVFERDAAHVERLCALVSGQDGRATPSPANAAGGDKSDLTRRKATGLSIDTAGSHKESLAASTPSPLLRRSSGSPPHDDGLSSPVTVAHGVSGGGRFAAPATTETAQPTRGVPSGSITKRSLASQYAIRNRKGTTPQRRGEFRRALFFVSYQLFLIVCGFLVPRRLSRWLVNTFANLGHRQPYSYDPQMVANPTMELLNHTLNVQFFARHPYALENRGAMQAAMLLQCTEKARRPASPATATSPALTTAQSGHNCTKPAGLPPAPGWKIMLIPYIEKPCSAPPPMPRATTPCVRSEAASHRHRAASSRPLGPAVGGRGEQAGSGSLRRTTTRAGLAGQRGYLCNEPSASASSSSRSASSSAADVADALDGLGGVGGSGGEWRSAAECGNVVYSSYAKGAGLIVDEWDAMLAGTVDVGSAGRLPMGGSGELDPYTAVKNVAPPPWAAADPLALTGAQSYLDPSRSGTSGGDDYFLMSADGTMVNGGRGGHTGGVGAFASRASAQGPPSGQVQVAKRRIFYQAVVFPPLVNGAGSVAGGTASSGFHAETDDGSGSGNGSDGTRTTVLSRLRRKNRAAPLRPAVPVRASPRQSWIYLRFWLSVFLMAVVSTVSRLLGQSATPSSAMSEGPASAAGRSSSNVMTTSMTTIYRRMPAPPSLAADVSTLPGNGDVVLQPRHYSPLLTVRYFVPLSIPILYMYGGGKDYMFHADHWCTYIRQHRRRCDGISDVVEVQGGGHWFFAEKKYQKKVADRIAEFLAATPKFADDI